MPARRGGCHADIAWAPANSRRCRPHATGGFTAPGDCRVHQWSGWSVTLPVAVSRVGPLLGREFSRSVARLLRRLPCVREVDLPAEFEHSLYSFQSPPRQLRGLLRNAPRLSLEAIRDEAGTDIERDGWKLFLLAPPMLLFRTPGVAHVLPQEFKRRKRLFCEGGWTQLLRESVAAAQQTPPVRDTYRAPGGRF